LLALHPMTLDEKLLATESIKERSWGKILNHLKREFDTWAMRELCKKGHTDFKMAHMPVLMNIDVGGITNNELAKRTKVTKQAMSKVIRELQTMGYIKAKEDKDDKRSMTLILTEKGKKLVLSSRQRMVSFHEELHELIGEKKFNDVTNQLLHIIKHLESKS
jgi:DNA-binding MarR family transcriptional regulator